LCGFSYLGYRTNDLGDITAPLAEASCDLSNARIESALALVKRTRRADAVNAYVGGIDTRVAAYAEPSTSKV